MQLARLILAGLFGLSLASGRGEIAARYFAGVEGNPVTAPSPSTPDGGSWIAITPTTDAANFLSAPVSPDGASGWNAWRMLDNSTAASQFLYWSKPLNAPQLANLTAYGWRYTARMRLLDPVASNGGANSVYLLVGNNAGKRWILFFDLNAAGQIVVTPVGGTAFTLAGVDAAQYHLHEMTLNPATQMVEYRVDGAVKLPNYAGTTGTANGARWGTESSGGRGDGYFNLVELEIGEPPGPPAATAHPVSQSAAEGASVAFSAAFSRAPTAYQWYKDTVALAGETGTTLTIASVTAGSAGDYWCRATNALGRGETSTAALEALLPGAEPVISEFLAENDGGLRDEDADRSDWLELHNPGAGAVNLNGWWLTDNPALPQKWALPAATLAAGERRVVFASGKNRQAVDQPWHTNFALQNQGGHLALVRPDGTVAHAYANYPVQYADASYGLTAHQPRRVRFFASPTPGGANTDGQSVARGAPTFTPGTSVFTNQLAVAVAPAAAMPPGGLLRVTEDGSRPTFDSPVHAGERTLSGSRRLRAAVVYPGERFGVTATASYLRAAPGLAAFSSPHPLIILDNFGAGSVPGVSARGPNGDGSEVVAVDAQPQSLLILDGGGTNTVFSPVATAARAGVRVRGSSSFFFARKSYALETWTERDDDGLALSLLGLPAESDWVLYGPDPAQFDAPLVHNSFLFEAARQAGIAAPRWRFVELFLHTGGGDLTAASNLGLYLLLEKPKRDKNRIDVPVMNAAGTAGGWILGLDRMDALPVGATLGSLAPRHFHTAGPDRLLQTPEDNPRGFKGPFGPNGLLPERDDRPGNYNSFFNFVHPRGWDILPAQRQAIQDRVRAFDAALYGPDWQHPTLGYAPYIDTRSWAQALLMNTFSKCSDGLVLSTYLHAESPAAPIRFGPIWDFDRAFNKHTADPSATTTLNHGHDRVFFQRLTADLEFMQAYIDAWQDLRRGAFTTANLHAILDAQQAQITDPVAVRSGLAAGDLATRIAILKTWVAQRGDAMDAQFTAPPVFSHPGGAVPEGFSLAVSAPAGTVYFTLDGSDPRASGGSVAVAAQPYGGPLAVVSNTVVTARALSNGSWSGTTRGTFIPPRDYRALRVSEIHYHPAAQTVPDFADGDLFEFIELKNTGPGPLDLAGLIFTNGIGHTFGAGQSLAPGAFWVLARDATRFASRFGQAPDGVYTGRLDNAGETVALAGATGLIWSVTYGDRAPWPPEADGAGFSLQRILPDAPGHAPSTWTAAAPTPWADLSLADLDANGMPDYWEILHGITDPAGDADGDGFDNRSEFLAGTHPRSPASFLHLTITLSGSLRLEFDSLANRAYRLQRADVPGSWVDDTVISPGSDDVRWISPPLAPTGDRVYYRLATP